MQAVNFNPFTWDNSSKKIKSSVTSLNLQSGNGKKINVSNLDGDIEIVIPISSLPTNTSNGTEHYFLKPNRMSFRSYYAELADVPVSIKKKLLSYLLNLGKDPLPRTLIITSLLHQHVETKLPTGKTELLVLLNKIP